MIRFTIGCGGEYDRDSNPIRPELLAAMKRTIIACATDQFGGCTLRESQGGWRSASGHNVLESGFSVEILCEAPEREREVRQFARRIKKTLQQDSVILIVEPVRAEFI